MIINITDPIKGSKEYNLSDALDFKTFSTHCANNGVILQHMADVLKSKKAAGYRYSIASSKTKWNNEKGWTYCLVVDNKIVKIGMSEVTLSSRFSSYQAGTITNRNKGTCSVTNFYVSQLIREALANNLNIKIYAYSVPTTQTSIQLFGKTKKVDNKNAYAYETFLLEEYQSLFNRKLPPLCRNSSKI